jgi:hypothetical protein
MSKMNSTTELGRPRSRRTSLTRAIALGVALVAFASGQQDAFADPIGRAQAKRMYDRLTGTPPSPAVLDSLETYIAANGAAATALHIVNNESDPRSQYFYSVTLKNFATPWTNRDQNVFAPLNDYTATVIGLVRDEADFRRVLWDNVLYVGSSGSYSVANNDMYEALESNSANLREALVPVLQSSVNGLPPDATAGVITSRAAAQAFFIDGTNRAMFRFTLLNHLCRDMEQVMDITKPPDRIRQDVTRSPGGDSSVFMNNCLGCHSVMDSMAQAFAYYDFDETVGANGQLVYTPGDVQAKYLINSDNFKPGYVTPDDQWENRMRLPGQNTLLGWSSTLPGKGAGAKSMGLELASSDAFAQCQVEKVFRAMCFRSPSDVTDRNEVTEITNAFKGAYGGNLKRVFADTAAYCAGN